MDDINPQAENGHTDIANEILEALGMTRLSPYESCFLFILWRKTYGWHKKEDYISNSQFAQATGIPRSHICRTQKRLIDRKIVTQTGNKLAFNKMYTQWRELPKQVTVTQTGNKVTQTGNKVTQTGNSELPKQVHTKETITKETYTKEINLSPAREKIIEKWNSVSVDGYVANPSVKPRVPIMPKCKNVTKALEQAIDKQLKDYDAVAIVGAITEYAAEIIRRTEGVDGYFRHRFRLIEFIEQKNGLRKFLT